MSEERKILAVPLVMMDLDLPALCPQGNYKEGHCTGCFSSVWIGNQARDYLKQGYELHCLLCVAQIAASDANPEWRFIDEWQGRKQ